MSLLNNKVAIVTGSASGIGEGIARILANNNVKLVINSVSSTEKGEQIANEFPDAIYCQGNIGIEADCRKIVDTTIAQFGRIDILVNNAGNPVESISTDPCDISNELFSQILDINIVGTWCLTRYAMPHLKQSGSGHIINITSCAGIDPAGASSSVPLPYSVAKAAINHLTKFLAKHCGPEVRANAIAPGLIMTPRMENFPEAVNKFTSRTPLKCAGTPNDIAELVLAIIKSSYINGEVILADGGFSVV